MAARKHDRRNGNGELVGVNGKKIGRPTKFTSQLAARICDEMAEGQSLTKICAADDMPRMETVIAWEKEKGHFSQALSRARRARHRVWADEVVTLADDGTEDIVITEDGRQIPVSSVVQRDRLRIESRKWRLSKEWPEVYGDKVDHHHSGSIDVETRISLRGRSTNEVEGR